MSSIRITARDFFFHQYLGSPNTGFWFDEQCTEAAIEVNRFLQSGWRGYGWYASKPDPMQNRLVLIAANVCPRYSSSGYYTIQFLVPSVLGSAEQFQRYDLAAMPDIGSLPKEILFLAIPGDEEQIIPWLASLYTVSVHDGPWTPPDLLGNSWLVYRTIFASLQ